MIALTTSLTRRGFMRCASCATVMTIAAIASAGCGAKPSGPQPPDIAFGRDVCEQCGMIISEARFACATVLDDGNSHKFDDIGEMVMYHMDHPDQQVSAYFVHDYNTEKWMRGEPAFYVQSDSLKTPMGHGLAAFAAKADAEAYAAKVAGKVFNFDEMRADVHVRLHS